MFAFDPVFIPRPTFEKEISERVKTNLTIMVNPKTGDYQWQSNDGHFYSWGIGIAPGEKDEEQVASVILENYAYSVLDANFNGTPLEDTILVANKKVTIGDLFEEDSPNRRLLYLFGTKSNVTKNIKAVAKALANERKRVIKGLQKLKGSLPLSVDVHYTLLARTSGVLELLPFRVIIGCKPI